MPRKPNYRFERSERDKVKAAKKAERLKAKTEKAEARNAGLQKDSGAETSEQGE